MSIYGSTNQYFTGNGTHGTGDDSFADPFADLATKQMPTTMKSALWWSEYIWTMMGTYRTAMERIANYFITEIEVGGDVGDDERALYEEFLTDKLDVLNQCRLLAREGSCYGNGFFSLIVPFKRFLRSPFSGDEYALDAVYNNPTFNFTFTSDCDFVATCPQTGKRGVWSVVDRAQRQEDHLIPKRWSPHEIEILSDEYTGQTAYLWRIPETYKRAVKKGNLFHLERASKQVLKAIKEDKLYRFHTESIFHWRDESLAGIRSEGWGLPKSLVNYRQIWYVQLLRRYNEAIALDYVIPFRLITPEVRSGASSGSIPTTDPMAMFNAVDMRTQIHQMVARRRRDPAAWHTLGFPVTAQMLGGDASQLAPTDLIEHGYSTLLNECAVPVELYQGTLTAQSAPMAARLFESNHRQMVSNLNRFLAHLVERIADLMSWQEVTCKMKPTTLADDIEAKTAALQLMMSQQLSQTSGLSAIGYDWKTEQKRIADEARQMQELQAAQAEQAEQAGVAMQVAKGINPATGAPASQGAAPAGGDPAAQGGDPAAQGGDPAMAQAGQLASGGASPVDSYLASADQNAAITPVEMEEMAGAIAQELIGLPEIEKNRELKKLRDGGHGTLHSAVKEKLAQLRRDFRQQGGDMLMQQQMGAQ